MTTKKPTHRAYVVPATKEGKKAFWHEVGVVWPHKNGTGFEALT